MPTKGFIFSLSFDKYVEEYKWMRLSNEIKTNTMTSIGLYYSVLVEVKNHGMWLMG